MRPTQPPSPMAAAARRSVLRSAIL
ncbi:hypothetical protein Taro_005275 [Colocasia esculenta]|uniref:Uncharacterized protein n=1 Tax=Colocasia esculenta TaxID=4460 RepID=A0A843TU20_COLES|nr:hypothetical protein [Colocasia esculenta]